MRAGFGKMAQLLTVPALGLPALNDHRNNLTLVLQSVGNGCKPPSVQTHGEDIITVRCPVVGFGLGDILNVSIFA